MNNYKNINDSPLSIDKIFYENDFLNFISVGGYPVLGFIWNVILIIIPFFLCQKLLKHWKKSKFKKNKDKALALFLFALWLIFIPNSAYIITEARHLLGYCPLNSPFDVCPQGAWLIMFFSIYSYVGWFSFVYLLQQMKFFVRGYLGEFVSNVFIIFIIPLIALGVLLGLVDRWNSWELFVYHNNIFIDVIKYFTDWIYFRNFFVFTISFYLLYFFGSHFFKIKAYQKKYFWEKILKL